MTPQWLPQRLKFSPPDQLDMRSKDHFSTTYRLVGLTTIPEQLEECKLVCRTCASRTMKCKKSSPCIACIKAEDLCRPGGWDGDKKEDEAKSTTVSEAHNYRERPIMTGVGQDAI